jgi:MOSC domain-containing protein YiiM
MAEWVGRITSIQIAPKAGEKMISVREVGAVAGEGLEGDRYFEKKGTYSNKPWPDRQITLVELESVEALRRDLDIELDPVQTRRNIVTHGVPLNHLVGKQFKLGQDVILRGIRLCEPCEHLESLTLKGVRGGLVHRGGLRAEILKGGKLKVNDQVTPA